MAQSKPWTVTVADKCKLPKKPQHIRQLAMTLAADLELTGGAAPDWPNYGRLEQLSGDHRHCHLKKGKPTYVAVWSVDKKSKNIVIIYVGTHEKAPYKKK